ncbi:MAG: transposase [Candidatus Woesearchaeota archaeon]
MAVFNQNFADYLFYILNNSGSVPAFYYDPILHLAEVSLPKNFNNKIDIFLNRFYFSKQKNSKAKNYFKKFGIIGIFKVYFDEDIVDRNIDISVERKVFLLKSGFQNLPSTKMAIIVNGFGHEISSAIVKKIYSTYALAKNNKNYKTNYDFIDINLRVDKLFQLINKNNFDDELQKVNKLYLAMRNYILADKNKKSLAIKNSNVGHSLFFNYYNNFKIYGILGLIDKGKEVFRKTKIGLENESKIVIDKLQHPERSYGYYIKMLATKGISADRTAIAKIFKRWNTKNYMSKFVSNLMRLEKLPEINNEAKKVEKNYPDKLQKRYIDEYFFYRLQGLQNNSINISSPGLFVLWFYIEELNILPVLESMELTKPIKGYCWFDHLLFNIARIFNGISSYTQACKIEEPTISFFSHLIKPPCNDTFINGLGGISEQNLFELQQYIIFKLKELDYLKGKNIAYDFHHIDMNVQLENIRQFGKGYSPKKKICCSGFRPHLAWDLDTGTIIVAEFRKASARAVNTIKRFVNEYIMPAFDDIVENIYIDSEYTSKSVWDFVINEKSKNGMNANLVACLKQNLFVKKYRDKFISQNKEEKNFWIYYDEYHVYSSKTFELKWEYKCPKTNKVIEHSLNCVVKKNIKTGGLRCFGTSKNIQNSLDILNDYSKRWIIENGIKDLNISYFLDKCPGTNPHHVNVHFFTVSLCRQLYRMMQRDLGDLIKNPDGSLKTLHTMREILIRQGCSKMRLNNKTIEIYYENGFTVELNNHLNSFYNYISERCSKGLDILGGLKLKYNLEVPYGDEHKNSLKKVVLSTKNFF